MNLLQASITLVDAAKQMPESKSLLQAIKRMEKRIEVLQLRATKARRRNRSIAWETFLNLLNSKCKGCNYILNFGEFVKNAEISGRGITKFLLCPKCNYPIYGETPDEI